MSENGQKRVFNIDIETCRECGGAMKVIACIEDPVVMPNALAALAGQALQKILNHVKEKVEYQDAPRLAETLGPPQMRLTISGREIAGLLRGDFSAKRGDLYFLYYQLDSFRGRSWI